MTARNPIRDKLIKKIRDSGVAPKGTSMSKDGVKDVEEQGKGLWHNIHMKRKRGEKMRKKGEKGAPTADQMARAKGEAVSDAQRSAIAMDMKARGKKPKGDKVDELSLSTKDITKSGINPTVSKDKDKIKKDLEKLRKGLKDQLDKNSDAGDFIDDFKKSDAPQFKGKSDKKKRDMAIAAYLSRKDQKESVEESFMSRRPGNQMSDLYKLYSMAMKTMPGSPKQKEIEKRITALRKELKLDEDVPANSTADIPNPADTVQGPRKKKKEKNKPQLVVDRRFTKKSGQPVLLKKFRDYNTDKGIS